MGKPQLSFVGRVTSAGVTNKVATVQTTFQEFDRYLQRHYTRRQKFHISDPTNSLHTNDVVRFIYNPYLSRSKNVAHTVTEIINPWGPRLSERPPLLSDEERAARRAIQVSKSKGPKAEALAQGQYVIEAGGRLTLTPPEGMGWKKFGGVLDELSKARAEEHGEENGEEGVPDKIWWIDSEGKRRQIQSQTMRKVRDMMRQAENAAVKAESELKKREEEGIDVDLRMEGTRVTGGEALQL